MNAPGYMPAKVADGYVAAMDPTARRFAELINGPSALIDISICCARSSPRRLDPAADVGSMIVDLDRVAETLPVRRSTGSSTPCSRRACSPATARTTTTRGTRCSTRCSLGAAACRSPSRGRHRGRQAARCADPRRRAARPLRRPRQADGDVRRPVRQGVRYDQAGMVASWQRRMGGGRRVPTVDAGRRPRRATIVLRILNNLKHTPRRRATMPCCWPAWRRCAPRFPSSPTSATEHRRWMRHFN